MLNSLAKLLAKALIQEAGEYLTEHPEIINQAAQAVADKVIDALPSLVDKATDVTPWQWDDQLIDGFVAKLAPTLANLLAGKLNLGNIIGGFLGGKK